MFLIMKFVYFRLWFHKPIYKFSLSVCLFVCLYPINVKTTEPIRPKFCVGPQGAPGKVYGQSDFKYII